MGSRDAITLVSTEWVKAKKYDSSDSLSGALYLAATHLTFVKLLKCDRHPTLTTYSIHSPTLR
ncbi:MAG: hypothetical protein RM338_34270 [Nostoc sp. DedQUE12a]|nr:hypothetical protein [Nostoc sp. DedQUE12a]